MIDRMRRSIYKRQWAGSLDTAMPIKRAEKRTRQNVNNTLQPSADGISYMTQPTKATYIYKFTISLTTK